MKRLRDNKNFRHIIWGLVVTVILLFIIFKVLKLYTKFGDNVVVPNLVGYSVNELDKLTATGDFNLVVIDSVFDINKKRGTVAYQDPPPDSKVKRHRTVYLTVVAMLPEQVRMPNLIDLTLRQASATLETFGLQVGNLDFIPDIAKNAVLRQKYKGREIKNDTWIEKGSKIDLVLGKGVGSDRIILPFLIGMRRSEAVQRIMETNFVLGNEVYEDAKDSIHSRVYRQNPAVNAKGPHQAGERIDIWYRSDKKVDFDAYIKTIKTDSLGFFPNDSL